MTETIVLKSLDGTSIKYELKPGEVAKVSKDGGLAVIIDTTLTPELISEYYTNEIVHHIQRYRKNNDFDYQDRINVSAVASIDLQERLKPFIDYIKQETLIDNWNYVTTIEDPYIEIKLDEQTIQLSILKVKM